MDVIERVHNSHFLENIPVIGYMVMTFEITQPQEMTLKKEENSSLEGNSHYQ